MSGRNLTCNFSQKANVRNYALYDKHVIEVSCVLLSTGKNFVPMKRRRLVVARILAISNRFRFRAPSTAHEQEQWTKGKKYRATQN